MYITYERCLQCGARVRPSNLPYQFGLHSDGSFHGSDYWFCSVTCYQKAVRPFISDDEYGFGREFGDDPDLLAAIEDEAYDAVDFYRMKVKNIQEKKLAEYRAAWYERQADIIVEAESELLQRVEAEADYVLEQEYKKELEATLKREEQAMREAEKQAEAERKEAEKEAERQAEEEKWKPRRFDI
jgi:YHS domain-containing protein